MSIDQQNTQAADINIRLATEADVPLIYDFIMGLAEYEKLVHEMVATHEGLRESLFEHKQAEVVIAEVDGLGAGFALFFHNYSTFLGKAGIYLEDLFVLPEKRGLGIGKKLLTYLAALAVERGCGRLEWSCLDWNEPSIKFYKSLGALPMDDWTVYRVTGETLKTLGESY